MIRIYLIAPRIDADGGSGRGWTSGFDGTEDIVRTGSAAAVTVAAFVPDDMQVTIVDEILEPVDLEHEADVVAISANVSQARRAIELARHFRSRGRTVIVGGPHVTLAPHLFVPHADCLVVGELEPIAATLFADLRAGRLQPRYAGAKADLATSPMPRWDLYPNHRVMAGTVQTSRGCPFECNFCDVIQYLGRVQRHKPVNQVIAELQQLYELGYAAVALADDNFTVYRKRAFTLLDAIAAWNGTEGRQPLILATQVSIDLARDDELIAACAKAGLHSVFIGIETDNADGLLESRKRQNLRVDIKQQCEKVVRGGLQVTGGLIVGFDSDDLRCFERQFDFAMSLPVHSFNVSVLVAPVATPLYQQMADAKRLAVEDESVDIPGSSLLSNFHPLRMTRSELEIGAHWLISRIYNPDMFAVRLRRIAELLTPAPWRARGRQRRMASHAVQEGVRRMMRRLTRADPRILRLLNETRRLQKMRPEIDERLQDVLVDYLIHLDAHRRRGTYDPVLAAAERPPLAFDRAKVAV